MGLLLKKIIIENFKSYGTQAEIDISDLSLFLGANSSGKSTAIQALMALKQTIECNSPGIEFLLCGKYVTLGDFSDVINDKEQGFFTIGVLLISEDENENTGGITECRIKWRFVKDVENAGVKLEYISIEYNKNHIVLRSEQMENYRVYVDDKITELSASIINLSIKNLVMHFDESFNMLYKEFIDSIIKIIFGNKSRRVDSKYPVSLRQFENMYYYLMQRRKRVNGIKRISKKDTDEVAANIVNLLDQYSEMQGKYAKDFTELPTDLKKDILSSAIADSDNIEEFEKIYRDFSEKLNEYDSPSLDKWEGHCILPGNYLSLRDDKNTAKDISGVRFSLDIYQNFQREILKRIFFLGPIRENPQGLYNIGFDTIPKYVGPTGAYFASVLLHQNKTKEYFFPDNETDTVTLLEALDEWMLHLNVASKVTVDRNNSFGFSVSVANTQNKTSDIMNVGIGTSQVLPVLITGLLSEPNEVLIFEQPELHLHPYSQSRLADFFIELIKNGRKVIIETHSEYMILRLRYHVLTERIEPDRIAINFFQNKEGTKVKRCEISGFGNLDYPEDFHDETQELLNELMNAALTKREEEC